MCASRSADLRRDSGSDSPPFNHPQRVVPVHRIRRQIAATADVAEEGSGRLLSLFIEFFRMQPRRVHILHQVCLGIMVQRHLVMTTAFFVEPHPVPAITQPHVFNSHLERRADAGERVDHQGNDRPVPQSGDGRHVDGIEQSPGFARRENRRLAFGDDHPRSLDGRSRIRAENAARDEIVEQHADRGQMLLHGQVRVLFAEFFDVRRNQHWLDLREWNLVTFCPGAKPATGPHVRRSRVRIADVRREELDEPPDCIRPGIPNHDRHRDTHGRGKLTVAGNQFAVVQLRRRKKMHR